MMMRSMLTTAPSNRNDHTEYLGVLQTLRGPSALLDGRGLESYTKWNCTSACGACHTPQAPGSGESVLEGTHTMNALGCRTQVMNCPGRDAGQRGELIFLGHAHSEAHRKVQRGDGPDQSCHAAQYISEWPAYQYVHHAWRKSV